MVEHSALQEAKCVTDVANAVMRAREYDPTRTAIGLAVIAATVAGDNQTAKTMLAFTFLKMASELDPDVMSVRWQ